MSLRSKVTCTLIPRHVISLKGSWYLARRIFKQLRMTQLFAHIFRILYESCLVIIKKILALFAMSVFYIIERIHTGVAGRKIMCVCRSIR